MPKFDLTIRLTICYNHGMRKVETITKAAFARELGISKPRVSQFVLMGLPVRPDGRLDRVAALQWHRDNIIPRAVWSIE